MFKFAYACSQKIEEKYPTQLDKQVEENNNISVVVSEMLLLSSGFTTYNAKRTMPKYRSNTAALLHMLFGSFHCIQHSYRCKIKINLRCASFSNPIIKIQELDNQVMSRQQPQSWYH